MGGAVQQAAIFFGAVALTAAALALALRGLRWWRRWPSINVPAELSLEDAARFARQETEREDLPLARVIGRGRTTEGAIAWFANSISKWGPPGATTVTRKQLRRYLKWARAVQ